MKGQLRITQTLFIVLILLVLVIMGLVTFFQYEKAGIESKAEEYQFNKFQQLIHVIPSMPEFQCSRFGVVEDCIDFTKIRGFASVSEDYVDFFGDKKIVVTEVLWSNMNVTLYDHEPSSWEDERIVTTLVSLYYPNRREYGVGELEIRWYS